MRAISSAAYVTAVLRFLEAYNAGDFEAAGELLTPGVEWHGVTSRIGRTAVIEYFEGLHGRWEGAHARPEDFRAGEDGRVLMVVTFTGEGAHGQRPLEEHQSWICDMTEDGKISRVIVHPTPADAFHAFEDSVRHARG